MPMKKQPGKSSLYGKEQACYFSDERVSKARDEVKKAYEIYQQETLDENRLKYNQAKPNLKQAYNCVIEDHLSSKLRQVEEAHVNCKHGESWSLINEITGRRSSVGGQLKEKSQQERIENWFNHFKKPVR